jgi:hypothetical protein
LSTYKCTYLWWILNSFFKKILKLYTLAGFDLTNSRSNLSKRRWYSYVCLYIPTYICRKTTSPGQMLSSLHFNSHSQWRNINVFFLKEGMEKVRKCLFTHAKQCQTTWPIVHTIHVLFNTNLKLFQFDCDAHTIGFILQCR